MSASAFARSAIYGTYIAVDAPVKPGGYHRLRLDTESRLLVCNAVAIADQLVNSFNLGERVRRGDISLPSVEIGKTTSKAMRDAYRLCEGRVFPSLITPLLFFSFSLGYSGADSILREPGLIKRPLEGLLSSSKQSDVKAFIEALKSVRRDDIYEHLSVVDIAGVSLIASSVTFEDVFRVLSSRWPGFGLLNTKEFPVVNYVRGLMEYKKKLKSVEASVVALYLDLVSPKMPAKHREAAAKALSEGLTNVGSLRKLMEIDTDLRRQKIVFNEYVEMLAVVVSLGVYEGLTLA